VANAKGIRAGKAYVELGVSNKLTAGLKRAQKQLRAFGAGVRQMGQRLVVAASGVLAVRIDGQAYLVEGSDIDDHGDAHGPDGLCNVMRYADVTGKLINGKLKVPRFRLVGRR
jgi:hypothetical protein